MSLTVHEVAALVSGIVEGGPCSVAITGTAALSEAGEGQVTFFGNAKYLPALRGCRASAVLVPLDFNEEIGPVRIRVANPSLAFAQVLERLAPAPITFAPGVHPTAVLGENVTLGEGVTIQPYVVLEPGVKIGAGTFLGAHSYVGHESVLGENCRIYPNVTLRERTLLGNRVIIHSGAVIGGDGFGFELADGRHAKIPQTGIVQIDDDVEIGANTTIDRARFGRTWIQEGTKIDNLVQIAHNVIIGKHSLIISQTGISGSTKLGNYVTLAGQVGVVGHIEIGDQAVVAAKGGVSKSVPPKTILWGSPIAGPIREEKEKLAYVNRLPKLYARVKALEQILGERENSSPESL